MHRHNSVVNVRSCFWTTPYLAGRPLRDLDLPGGTTIVLVRRDGEIIYPRGHTTLQLGDRLTLMGD